jgi:hypothetical protein
MGKVSGDWRDRALEVHLIVEIAPTLPDPAANPAPYPSAFTGSAEVRA